MQDEMWECGKKVKKAKDGKYVNRYGVKIWSQTNKYLNIAQEIR